jgi:TatA/E family protein of Tat protein translocase
LGDTPKPPRTARGERKEQRVQVGLLQPVHWLIILVVVVLVLGPGRLRGLGQALGQSWRALIAGFHDGAHAAPPPSAALPARACVRCGVWSGEMAAYCTRCGAPLP